MIKDARCNNSDFYFEDSNNVLVDEMDKNLVHEHYHALFELYYLKSGSCMYFIDNKSYRMKPGDLAIIPKGLIHNTQYDFGEHSRLLINCQYSYIPAQALDIIGTRDFIYRNEEINGKINSILVQIGKEYAKKDEFSNEMIRSLMYMIFFLIARNKNEYNEPKLKSKYVEKTIKYIKENISGEINLSDISDNLHITAEHLSREFKRETGFGFCEFVNILRLKNAEQLIRGGRKMSVTELSAACGYNDSNYFSVKFKGMYGISPKKMQQQMK